MVYVDEIRTIQPKSSFVKRFGNQWCHMTIEYGGNLEELHTMAEKIGLARRWFQDHPTHPHYDLTPNFRAKALVAGAVFKPQEEQARERIVAWRSASARNEDKHE